MRSVNAGGMDEPGLDEWRTCTPPLMDSHHRTLLATRKSTVSLCGCRQTHLNALAGARVFSHLILTTSSEEARYYTVHF